MNGERRWEEVCLAYFSPNLNSHTEGAISFRFNWTRKVGFPRPRLDRDAKGDTGANEHDELSSGHTDPLGLGPGLVQSFLTIGTQPLPKGASRPL